MSKKLTLLAFVAITAFGSTSVYADTHNSCRNLIATHSKKKKTTEEIDARCTCVVAKGTPDNRGAIEQAIQHCASTNNNPHG